MAAEIAGDLEEVGATPYAVEVDGRVVGWIQWSEEPEPAYRLARRVDLYLDPAVHGRGIGTDTDPDGDATTSSAAHGHRRFEIDPATDNAAAIACYTKVGFRPVGVLRLAEQGTDGVVARRTADGSPRRRVRRLKARLVQRLRRCSVGSRSMTEAKFSW